MKKVTIILQVVNWALSLYFCTPFHISEGGGRTSWQKEWFSSKDPFTIKSDFGRESRWPSPDRYRLKSTFGDTTGKQTRCSVSPSFKVVNSIPAVGYDLFKNESQPVHQVDADSSISSTAASTSKEPTLSELNVMKSVNRVKLSAPKIALKFRENGTMLWPKQECTPGPGAYNQNKFKYIYKSNPKFTLSQARVNLNCNHTIGPFAAF
jgi:hypothetical protein